MSEGTQKPSELLKAHVAAGGWENDEIILDAAGKAFFPERYAPPPKEEVREVIPPGYIKHPEAKKFEEARAAKDFEAAGRMVGALELPTLVVQEGGYRIRTLGMNARNFFVGLWEQIFRSGRARAVSYPRRKANAAARRPARKP